MLGELLSVTMAPVTPSTTSPLWRTVPYWSQICTTSSTAKPSASVARSPPA